MISSPGVLINILFFVWFLALTAFVLRFYFYYSRLVKNGKSESLVSLLDELLAEQKNNKNGIAKLQELCDTLENEGKLHIQKIGLVRFNPFKDTGGDQSFILALVDGDNSGVVISSLHTRTGTRWYAKQVKRGKGLEYELSEEEVKALKGAKILADKTKKDE